MQPIYVVLIINLIVWVGIFSFQFATDNKVKQLSKKLDRLTNKDSSTE